jgi:hypothetical protein
VRSDEELTRTLRWRTAAAIAALIAMIARAGIETYWATSADGADPGDLFFHASYLGLAVASIYGLVRRRTWGRWPSIGLALWALALVAAVTIWNYGAEMARFTLGGPALVLIAALLGRSLFDYFEGLPDARWRWCSRSADVVCFRCALIVHFATIASLALTASFAAHGGWSMLAGVGVSLLFEIAALMLSVRQLMVGLALVESALLLHFVWFAVFAVAGIAGRIESSGATWSFATWLPALLTTMAATLCFVDRGWRLMGAPQRANDSADRLVPM